MRIEVDLAETPPIVALLDAEDTRSFSVLARGARTADPSLLREPLSRVGRLDGGDHTHAYIEVAALAALAGARAQDPQWLEAFEEMVRYASGHGWVDDAGALRAHVEWELDG
jgi:hypothetical protein